MTPATRAATIEGWDLLRHGGLLLDPQRLREIGEHEPPALDAHTERELRRRLTSLLDDGEDVSGFVAFVLESVCGFGPQSGGPWLRGSAVEARYGHPAFTGETIKPRHLWLGPRGGMLPVFIDAERRVGVGRGRRTASNVVQWLRASGNRLALITNGRQWRLVFAGLDFEAFCEAEAELFVEEGTLSPQLTALRTLLQPSLWTPADEKATPPLEQAILNARKGQAELSAVLGERVRDAVELLVQAHGPLLSEHATDIPPADIYRAAVRIVMRMVVVLFAESRELLPRDNTFYHSAYGLSGLIEELQKVRHRSGGRLARGHAAWPRVLSLFRLVHQGSSHQALLVPEYGGDLFAPGDASSPDGLSRALELFERGCFEREVVSDRDVHDILELITRTRVKIRQGRASTWVTAPVDFSDLSSEYIGILYEGLLDYELKQAPAEEPIVFLSVGNAPALPLSRLEAMDNRAIRDLLESMKKADSEGASEDSEEGAAEEPGADDDTAVEPEPQEDEQEEDALDPELLAAEEADARLTTRARADAWARRAVVAAGLVRRQRGADTPERRLRHEEDVARAARALLSREIVLPGEWYVVRWGGTRKGAGTFYTRPGLAVPTVQRTLRPLAYDPPTHADGTPNIDAPPAAWKPKLPEEILALKVVDPACGSGTFPVAALRYLTEALYESLLFHDRISDDPDRERAVVRLIEPPEGEPLPEERLAQELVPGRTTDPEFEPRLKALLRRHVVERCIYGVDLDPLAVELARLSLWIETMDRQLPFSFLDHKVKCGNALTGAWFDTFRHYPVMAFKNREGGDKGHSNGVNFEKDARGKALKAFASGPLKSDLARFLSGPSLFDPRDTAAEATIIHDDALSTLARLHELPVHDTAERARIYREELVGSPAYRQLKDAMDLWCACWFWPADELDSSPLPTTLHDPAEETRAIARRIAAEKRFFHWELEFPDVFREAGSGFDGVLGNPPWENLQPNPEEFFSNFDPMFRTYGRLQKNRRLREVFTADPGLERQWLDYSADFNAMSNWVTCAASPFGDPEAAEASGSRFAVSRGRENDALHSRWRELRAMSAGYADRSHPFRYQTGRIFTYRLFLEQCHALLRPGGRMGQIVPSGLYSDAWSQPLRELFLDRCRWEWLFGFENGERIFDIGSNQKFNPVIVQKGGHTDSIHTAFMRRSLEDWERAEAIAVPYGREQVGRLNPKSLALLEVRSSEDLRLLEVLYSGSVLLGDEGRDCWGATYKLEFMMNTAAHLFPPRPTWETRGYRPDEYSRWLLGHWRPIDELWAELDVDPARVVPAEIEIGDWLFDTTADPERRDVEAQFAHGHLLKPGDVEGTGWRVRCAQPPYDLLPIPRAEIPAGIVLSREGDEWVRAGEIEDVALPLYQGTMVGAFDGARQRWISGTGLSAKWEYIGFDRKRLDPQFLMAQADWPEAHALRVGFRDVARSVEERTMTAALLAQVPAGNAVGTLQVDDAPGLCALLNSFCFDWLTRRRVTAAHLNWFIVEGCAVPRSTTDGVAALRTLALQLSCPGPHFALPWVLGGSMEALGSLRLLTCPRVQALAEADAIAAVLYGVGGDELRYILRDTDHSVGTSGAVSGTGLDPEGFWRVDKDKDPELRHTVLTLVAFRDLEEKIRACGGDRDAGIEAFLGQNEGEGWMLPETLRLADYGLGHDERAKHPQPVASRLGPRFYDWQLARSAEESWRECHLHARNLLGEQPGSSEETAASLLDDASQGALW